MINDQVNGKHGYDGGRSRATACLQAVNMGRQSVYGGREGGDG